MKIDNSHVGVRDTFTQRDAYTEAEAILHNTGRLQNESKTFPRIFLFYQRISTEYGSISSRISQNSNPHKLLMKLAGAQLKDDVDSQTSLYPHPLPL